MFSEDLEEIVGTIFAGILVLGLGITFFVGLIKLCIWIWTI